MRVGRLFKLGSGLSVAAAMSQVEAVARTQLPARLDSAYRVTSTHAPHARVVVLDYPVFYQLGVRFCIGLSATSRAKIDEGINLLDGITSSAALRHHFTFGYLPVFAGAAG
jgi:hypothetical protein